MTHTSFVTDSPGANPVPAASARSTLHDFGRFVAMMARKGTTEDGRQVLRAASVDEIERQIKTLLQERAGEATVLVVAGLLVGVGTRFGSGCTSGHGVCGLSRLSLPSLVATMCFMATGFASVFVVRHVLGAS